MQEQQPLKIFIVYAHEDADALKELQEQFITVKRSERLEIWDDGEILPGQHWDKEIKAHLRSADIILLFISKKFFASEYIQSTEQKEALERHEAGKSVVVPVIVRPCVWQDDFDVSKFHALPANAHPIFSSLWRDPDEAMVSVVEGVKKVARNLRAERAERERLELIEKQRLEAEKAEKEHKERLEKERLAAEKAAREQRERDDHKTFNLARTRADFEEYLKKGFILHAAEARTKIDNFKKQEKADADRLAREQRERDDHEIFNLARTREDFEEYLKKGYILHTVEANWKIADFIAQEKAAADQRDREEAVRKEQERELKRRKREAQRKIEIVEQKRKEQERKQQEQVEAEEKQKEQERLAQIEAEKKQKKQEPVLPPSKGTLLGYAIFSSVLLFVIMYIVTLLNYSIRLHFFSDYEYAFGYWKTIYRLAILPSLIMGSLCFIFYISIGRVDPSTGFCLVLALVFLIFELIYPTYHFYGASIGWLKNKTEKQINGVAPGSKNPVTSPQDSGTIDPTKLLENLGGTTEEKQNIEDNSKLTPLGVGRKSGLEMVSVQGGTFIMGCKTGRDSDCFKDEKPAHKVTLSSFSIGMYEVTQADWREIMGNNPSFHKNCDDCPVEQVSWNDIQDFLKKANAIYSGGQKEYRLPTEAEWEFAARGGNQSKGYNYSGGNTLENVAWFFSNSGLETHPVGGKKANEVGIFDMSGNVWEWCSDWSGKYPSGSQSNPTGAKSGSYRVFRGGSCSNPAQYNRAAHRLNYLVPPSNLDSHIGLRLASSHSIAPKGHELREGPR